MIDPNLFLETILVAGDCEIRRLARTAIRLVRNVSAPGQRTSIGYGMIDPLGSERELMIDLEAITPPREQITRLARASQLLPLEILVEVEGDDCGEMEIFIYGKVGNYIAFEIRRHPYLPSILFRLT